MEEVKQDTTPPAQNCPSKNARSLDPANLKFSMAVSLPQQSPTRFHLLSQLPPEIRFMIWSLALQRQPRLIELAALRNVDQWYLWYSCIGHWAEPYVPDAASLHNAHPRPSTEIGHLCLLRKPTEIHLMSVCRESRRIAQKKYTFLFNTEQELSRCKWDEQCTRQLLSSGPVVLEDRPQTPKWPVDLRGDHFVISARHWFTTIDTLRARQQDAFFKDLRRLVLQLNPETYLHGRPSEIDSWDAFATTLVQFPRLEKVHLYLETGISKYVNSRPYLVQFSYETQWVVQTSINNVAKTHPRWNPQVTLVYERSTLESEM